MRARLPMLISITALLVAVLGATPLGRAAYDAALPRNSVGTPQLKRNAVKASKIAPNSIRTGQVVNGSLLTDDFKPGQIPQGQKGDKGEKGDKGNAGATNVVVRWSPTVTGPGTTNRVALCDAGEVAVGGGAGLTLGQASTSGLSLHDSKPTPNTAGGKPTGWFAGFSLTAAVTAAAYVICASP